MSLRACKLLGPIRKKKKKKAHFIIFSSCLALRKKAKAQRTPASWMSHYQQHRTSQGFLQQGHPSTLGALGLLLICPVPALLSGEGMFCYMSGARALHRGTCYPVPAGRSQGLSAHWGWMCVVCSPQEPVSLWGVNRRRNKKQNSELCVK